MNCKVVRQPASQQFPDSSDFFANGWLEFAAGCVSLVGNVLKAVVGQGCAEVLRRNERVTWEVWWPAAEIAGGIALRQTAPSQFAQVAAEKEVGRGTMGPITSLRMRRRDAISNLIALAACEESRSPILGRCRFLPSTSLFEWSDKIPGAASRARDGRRFPQLRRTVVQRNQLRILPQQRRHHFGVFMVKLLDRIHFPVGCGQQLLGVRPILPVKGRPYAQRQ